MSVNKREILIDGIETCPKHNITYTCDISCPECMKDKEIEKYTEYCDEGYRNEP